jgi:hypothetical protein
MIPFQNLFYMIAGHFVVDYNLQTDTTALQKNRNTNNGLSIVVPFYYWLLSHSFMHGIMVALATGSYELGILETVLHYIIDDMKCRKWFGIHMDQFLHVACKLGYFAFMVRKCF